VNAAKSKLSYLFRSLKKRCLGFVSQCPNCGSKTGAVVDSKYGVTRLIQCADCYLLYRTPTDTKLESDSYYQLEYQQGATTTMPDDKMLTDLKEKNFEDFSKSYLPYLRLFDALAFTKGTRILDFGCSWGYGTYQLQRAGMSMEGFELSRARAAFARDKLSLKVCSDLDEVGSDFDVFFSSHVLEHVSSLSETFSIARRLTKPGGLLVSITPNGSPEFRQANPKSFHQLWGLSHPNLLQATFLQNVFCGKPLFLGSDPYPLNAVSNWNRIESVQSDLRGWELLFIAVL